MWKKEICAGGVGWGGGVRLGEGSVCFCIGQISGVNSSNLEGSVLKVEHRSEFILDLHCFLDESLLHSTDPTRVGPVRHGRVFEASSPFAQKKKQKNK